MGFVGGSPEHVIVDSGTVTATATISGNVTVVQPDGANLHVDIDRDSPEIAGTRDIFGTLVTANRFNEIEVEFFSDTPGNLVTVTTTNGGTATQSLGAALFSTTANANGTAKGVSLTNVLYRAMAEVYACFTAAFTTPTDAGPNKSYQRIGLYSATDGFFVGYKDNVFGVTWRENSVDTFVAQSAWNGDTLSGAAGSKFTRAGVIEALDKTKLNIYRIRFGWLGSAPATLELLAPDGNWIAAHTFRFPNLQTVPLTTTPNLPMTIDVAKTGSDATNLVITTGCWAGGATSQHVPINATLTDTSLAALSRSVITGHTTAGGGSYVNVKVNPSGTLTVDASNSTALSTLTTLSTTARTTRAKIDAAASGDNTLIAGLGGQTIRVFKMFFVCDSAVDLYFRDGTAGTALTGTMKMGPGGAFTLDLDDDPWFVTSASNAFVVNLSAAVGIRGRIYYTQS